jgi:hypothetical protein
MAKLMELEVVPPGACTLTAAEPELTIKLAGTAAVSWVAELRVVASAEPFHSTASPDMKLVPVTVRVNPELPAVALAGDNELTAGVGGRGAETVNVTVTTPGEL